MIGELLEVRRLCAADLYFQSPGYFLLECLARRQPPAESKARQAAPLELRVEAE